MEIVVITLIILINILILIAGGGYYFLYKTYSLRYKELEIEETKINLDKYKFDEAELNKANAIRARLEFEKEKLLKELELERYRIKEDIEIKKLELDVELKRIYSTTNMDVTKEVIANLDTMIATIAEPFIKEKYTNIAKPLSENEYSEIIIPIGKNLDEDIKYIKHLLFNNMTPDFSRTCDKYFVHDTFDLIVDKMIKIYFNSVIYKLIEVKTAKAEEDNTNSAKSQLFIGGKLNSRLMLGEDVIRAVEYYKITNINDLRRTCDMIKAKPDAFPTAAPLLKIDLNNYR